MQETHMGKQSDKHKLHSIHPFHKVFARLFSKSRVPPRRDFVPRFIFPTCSHVWRGRYRGCPGIRYRAARLCTYLQYRLFTTCSRLISFAYLTCGLLINLRLAYILRYFIRNRRYSLVVCFVFFNEEYLIAPVDFIVALRRTKGRGRRTLRSPPSPWNHACVVHWTPPHPPGVIRCGGAFLLPRLTGI